jgi:trk system potassium uptake protein TrkH
MFLAGFNFTLIYRLLQGKPKDVFKNSEAKAYLLIILVSALGIGLSLLLKSPSMDFQSVEKSFRYGFFHTASIITTSGFVIADQNLWPPFAQTILFLLMFIGGSSGSTAGGVKVIRYVILWKQAKNEMKKLLHPKGVFSIQLDRKVGRKDLVYGVSGFIFLYFALVFAGTLLASSAGIDPFNALNASLLCVGNIGLGLGKLTTGTIIYESPAYVKLGLSFIMIAGRLELWTVFVLFMLGYWKK